MLDWLSVESEWQGSCQSSLIWSRTVQFLTGCSWQAALNSASVSQESRKVENWTLNFTVCLETNPILDVFCDYLSISLCWKQLLLLLPWLFAINQQSHNALDWVCQPIRAFVDLLNQTSKCGAGCLLGWCCGQFTWKVGAKANYYQLRNRQININITFTGQTNIRRRYIFNRVRCTSLMTCCLNQGGGDAEMAADWQD